MAGSSGMGDERRIDRAVFVISVAAELAGVHPQTLRMYERKGLLSPSRTPGNSRRYSERDVERLRQIQRLTQDEGVNLAGVRMVMELEQQLERLAAQLERTRRRIAEFEHRVNNPQQRWPLVRLADVRNIFEAR